jgi:hypothetical protein
MLLHYHSVEIYLYDICFSMPPTTSAYSPTFQRADVLFMCLAASQALRDVYFSIQSKPYISYSSVALSQIYLAMMTSSKLSLFNTEDWDVSNAQTSINLSTVVGRLVTMLEDMSARFDRKDDDKPWLQVSRKVLHIRTRFERLLATENRSIASSSPLAQSRDGVTVAPYKLDQFDLLDDGFWQSLLEDPTFIQ